MNTERTRGRAQLTHRREVVRLDVRLVEGAHVDLHLVECGAAGADLRAGHGNPLELRVLLCKLGNLLEVLCNRGEVRNKLLHT